MRLGRVIFCGHRRKVICSAPRNVICMRANAAHAFRKKFARRASRERTVRQPKTIRDSEPPIGAYELQIRSRTSAPIIYKLAERACRGFESI